LVHPRAAARRTGVSDPLDRDSAAVATPAARMARPQDKIVTLAELAVIVERLRRAGKSVVHAHGTFDLLHLGHVRHFQAARAMGDLLVVTVTADRFVNKGPGRPVFGEVARAEMLAALEYVDWVAINHAPDAVDAINQLRPSIYVKGQDYQEPDGDVTGKIIFERRAVEAHGGRIQFTDEALFSSSELLNRHFNIYEPHVRDHLRVLRSDGGMADMLALIEKVRGYRLAFIGDAIIDEYQYVLPLGTPPKESILAARYRDREMFAGGVFAAANHAASICAEVDIVTCLGAAEGYDELIRASLRPNVRLHAVRRPGASTTVKRRFIDPNLRKLFEVSVLDDEPLVRDVQQALDGMIARVAAQADVTVVTDFGHGMLAPSSAAALVEHARFLAVTTQSNSANWGYNTITKYPRADYVCIDAPEARLAVRDRVSKIGDVVHEVGKQIDCSKIIVTHGRHGCVTLERGGVPHTIPALAGRVVDTMGAGDAFLAVTAPLVAAGGVLKQVGFIGNVAGALKVEIVGHRKSIEKPALVKAITALLK
jgi:rfaE bifunctional protein nucleotidyltransferase chain/domain